MSQRVAHAEVWWCELPDIDRRPVVVLSRDVAIAALSRAMVAPCTTTVRGLPSEVTLEHGLDPVPRDCVVNLDSVESVGIGALIDRIGRLSLDREHEVCHAMAVAMDCATAK